MTEVDVQSSPPSATSGRGPGERLLRLRRRRKLVKEEILALLVLFVALCVTVAVLAAQWLGSTSSVSAPAVVPVKLALTLLGGST